MAPHPDAQLAEPYESHTPRTREIRPIPPIDLASARCRAQWCRLGPRFRLLRSCCSFALKPALFHFFVRGLGSRRPVVSVAAGPSLELAAPAAAAGPASASSPRLRFLDLSMMALNSSIAGTCGGRFDKNVWMLQYPRADLKSQIPANTCGSKTSNSSDVAPRGTAKKKCDAPSHPDDCLDVFLHVSETAACWPPWCTWCSEECHCDSIFILMNKLQGGRKGRHAGCLVRNACGLALSNRRGLPVEKPEPTLLRRKGLPVDPRPSQRFLNSWP